LDNDVMTAFDRTRRNLTVMGVVYRGELKTAAVAAVLSVARSGMRNDHLHVLAMYKDTWIVFALGGMPQEYAVVL